MSSFAYTSAAQQIIFGERSLAQLGDAVKGFGWQSVLLCTSPSSRTNGIIAQLETVLGERLVAVYDQVASHVPEDQVAQAVALGERYGVDAAIGLGGGSSIGMAKATSMQLEANRTRQSSVYAHYPTEQPLVSTIAIPTTYAGSEMTPIYGISRQLPDGSTKKVTVKDVKITPKLVIYDPILTLGLPASLTASTGINALAHCVEAVYSVTRHPLSSAAALAGIGIIRRALLACYREGGNVPARTDLLLGSHLAGVALATVQMGIHHGSCHILGGSAHVPHGVANAIMLPHVMRFNLDAVTQQLAQVAEAMGIHRNGLTELEVAEKGVEAVFRLIRELNLPHRLRDVGVAESDLPKLAREMINSKTVQQNPKPLGDLAMAESFLWQVW